MRYSPAGKAVKGIHVRIKGPEGQRPHQGLERQERYQAPVFMLGERVWA
jgi:hypothetical protein